MSYRGGVVQNTVHDIWKLVNLRLRCFTFLSLSLLMYKEG